MARTIILYALALAVAAAALEWLKFRYVTRLHSAEIYMGLVAIGFVALGLWAGRLLTPRPRPHLFQRNDAAIRSLGLSARECQILDQLAAGGSNKEIARTLGISPNTVKTHVASLLSKLRAESRAQLAAMAARSGVVADGAFMMR